MKKSEQRALADALAAVEALCDLGPDSGCNVAAEHKQAVQIYINSWVAPYIRMALRSGVLGTDATLSHLYRDGRSGTKTKSGAKILDDMRKQKQQEAAP